MHGDFKLISISSSSTNLPTPKKWGCWISLQPLLWLYNLIKAELFSRKALKRWENGKLEFAFERTFVWRETTCSLKTTIPSSKQPFLSPCALNGAVGAFRTGGFSCWSWRITYAKCPRWELDGTGCTVDPIASGSHFFAFFGLRLTVYLQHNVSFGVTHRSHTTGFLHIPTSKYWLLSCFKSTFSGCTGLSRAPKDELQNMSFSEASTRRFLQEFCGLFFSLENFSAVAKTQQACKQHGCDKIWLRIFADIYWCLLSEVTCIPLGPTHPRFKRIQWLWQSNSRPLVPNKLR